MSKKSRKLVEDYMQFSKYQRAQHLKTLKNFFQGIVESRLLEGTYTYEEVEEILRDVCNSVCGEVESEMMSTSHMTVLLLVQMMQQAEEVGVVLQGDFSEMQNGELLEKVQAEEMNSEPLYGKFPSKDKEETQSCSSACRQQGAAHDNLKKILAKKNEVIMQLREKLLKYESED